MAAEDRRNRNEQIKEALDRSTCTPPHRPLRPRGPGLDRPRRPQHPLPLVGPVHPAAGRGRPLHAAHPHPRGAAADQLEAIGRLAKVHGRNLADVTDRQNIQLHWVVIEDVPTILDELDRIGLSSLQACGDTVRNVSAARWPGSTPASGSTPPVTCWLSRPAWPGPRSSPTCPASTRCRSRPAATAAPSPRSTIWPWSAMSTPTAARASTCWWAVACRPAPVRRPPGRVHPRAEAPEVVAAVTSAYRDHGNRDKRTRARIKFLLAAWGPEKFREVVERDYLGRKLEDGPAAPPSPTPTATTSASTASRTGPTSSGPRPWSGGPTATPCSRWPSWPASSAGPRVRLTTQQKLVLLDVPDERVEEVVARLDALDLPSSPSEFHRGRWPAPA